MKKNCYRRFLFLLIAIMVVSFDLLSAQGANFIYQDNGRRDPFWPLISPGGTILIFDANVTFSDIILEGIIYDPKGQTLAIINTKVVKETDTIGGFLVVTIGSDHVLLRKEGQEFMLRSKKEK